MTDKKNLENIKKLREITGVGFSDCKLAISENDGDIEMGGSYTSIDSEPDIHLNQIVDAGSPENTRIANRVLRRLLKKNREIKERTFVLTLMGFLFDGFMIFSYYEICQRDRQCRYDIVVKTTSATSPGPQTPYLCWATR